MMPTSPQIQVSQYYPQQSQTSVPPMPPSSDVFPCDTEGLDMYEQIYAPPEQPSVNHPYDQVAPFQDCTALGIQSDHQHLDSRYLYGTAGFNLNRQVYQPIGEHPSYSHMAPFQAITKRGDHTDRQDQAFDRQFVDQTGQGVPAIMSAAGQWAWSHPSHSDGMTQSSVERRWDSKPFSSAWCQNSESSGGVTALSDSELLDFLNSQGYAEFCKEQESSLPAGQYTAEYGDAGNCPAQFPTVGVSINPHVSPYNLESSSRSSDAFWSNGSSSWTRDNARHGSLDGSYDPSDMTTSQTALIQPTMTEPLGARIYGLDSDPPQGSSASHQIKHLSHGSKMPCPKDKTSTHPANSAFVRLDHLPPDDSVFPADPTMAVASTSQITENSVASIRPKTPDQLAPADLGPVKARLSKGFYSNQSQEQLWGSKICPYDHIDRGKCRGIMSDDHFVRSHVKKEGVLWEKNGFKKDKLAKRHRSWIIHNQDMALRVAKSLYPCGVEDCNKTFARDQVAWVHRRSQHPKAPPIQSDRSDAESEVQLLQWIGRQS